MDTSRAAYVTVARIVRPHGRYGEVAAEILTDFPQRLKKLASAELWDPARRVRVSGPSPRAVRSCRLSSSRGGQALFHFEGSNSIDDAKKLVGLEVQIPIADRAPLPEGSYYASDLAGCELFDEAGRKLGPVREVQFFGESVAGTPILAVDTPDGELLVPLAQDICLRVDLAARKILAKLPEGLRDLNRDPNSGS